VKKRASQTTIPEVTCRRIATFLSETLESASITDYSCNGLQVEATGPVVKVGLAVDACMESFVAAAENGCNLLIVHHGIIWGGITSVTGRIANQLRYLFDNNCALYAAHLPLDLHPQYGNNAALASLLGLSDISPFGMYKGIPIGFKGTLKKSRSRDAVVDVLCRSLDTSCTVLPFGTDAIKTIGVVSGGAADALDEAIEQGLDCFITGESSHENYHAALEAKINVIYAGHYHTEKGGVLALGKLIEETFGVETVFLDIPTGI